MLKTYQFKGLSVDVECEVGIHGKSKIKKETKVENFSITQSLNEYV